MDDQQNLVDPNFFTRKALEQLSQRVEELSKKIDEMRAELAKIPKNPTSGQIYP